jgi:hypothetical protein
MGVFALSAFLIADTNAQPGKPDRKNNTENSTAIVTVRTQDILSGVISGVFSDLENHASTPSLRYYGNSLEGEPDPDSPGSGLDDGDCIVTVVPSQDGVDNGALTFFVPFGPSSCTEPRLRALEFRNPGVDFDLDGSPAVAGAPSIELPFGRLACSDVFPKDSPNPGVTYISCSYEVRVYDPSDEFEREWIIEWPNVEVRHYIDPDLKQIEATTAQIFRLAFADGKRKGKKQKIEVSPPGGTDLSFRFDIRRVAAP